MRMSEKYLTLEQNTCAARIFLNTFGLILESVSEVSEFSKIKIFDTSMKEVGQLHFDNGRVIMFANYNDSVLDASFDIAKMWGFADMECKNVPFALFGQWSSKIIFQVQNLSSISLDNIKLSGEFLLESSVDTEFGVSCSCRPLIKCDVVDKGEITLKILNDGDTFGLEIVSGNYKETMDVMPWDELNGFIKHVIIKGEYNPESYQHEYRKYMGVFPSGKGSEDKLHIFLSEKEWDNEISVRSEFPTKVGDDKSEALVIQKGMLMQDLDPVMFEKIKELRTILSIGDVSLFDNLVSVCYDSYTDEELSALLGMKRRPMNYQDGANSLINSYFGIGEKSQFLSVEQQKRLLKK